MNDERNVNHIPSLHSRRAGRVFAYVSDLTRHGEWNLGLRVEAVTAGPVGAGSQYHSWGKPAYRLNKIIVTEYQPPTRFAFVASQAGFPDVRHEFVFQAKDGRTLLERVVTATMALPNEILLRFVLRPFFGRPAMNKSMAALKEKLEQSSS